MGSEMCIRDRAFQAQSLQSNGDLVKAHEVASIGMKRFPESPGGRKCFNIFNSIEQPQLSLVAEQVWNGNQTEIQATHTNLSKVHFRLIPFDYRKWNWGNNDPTQLIRQNKKLFRDRAPVASWSAELPASKDFKPRTDAVPAQTDVKSGSYLLIASTSKDFNDDKSIQSCLLYTSPSPRDS